jgi:hypothetical protein
MKRFFGLLLASIICASNLPAKDRLVGIRNRGEEVVHFSAGTLLGIASGITSGYLIGSCKHDKVKIGPQGLKGPRGDKGSRGEDGGANFIVDEGASLNFNFFIELEKTPTSGVMVVPFVATPDGRIFNGGVVDANEQKRVNLGDISVEDPTYGSYHLGVQLFTVLGGFNEQTLDLIVEARASRENKTMTTLLERADFVEFKSSDQTQVTLEYTYSGDF